MMQFMPTPYFNNVKISKKRLWFILFIDNNKKKNGGVVHFFFSFSTSYFNTHVLRTSDIGPELSNKFFTQYLFQYSGDISSNIRLIIHRLNYMFGM